MMTELEALRARHSVRSYENRPIAEDVAQQLNELIAQCNEEGNVHLQLIDAGNTFNRILNKFMGLGSAPSIIACVGHNDETVEERIGYYGQKVVLRAQQLGLNTCWAGTYNPKNVQAEIAADEKLVIVIAIGYGTTNGKERKTKTMDKVVRGSLDEKPNWFLTGADCALMAPTAINQQRFELVLNEDESVEVIDKGGFMSKIDKGIVKYQFEVGANSARK